MLQKFREQKNSALIAILFGLIIIVFVFMFGLPGTDSCASKSRSDLGSMGSHNISYELTRSLIFKQYDDNIFSSKEYPSVAHQVVTGIGVVYMLADEARAAGLRVSDAELKDYITNWESGNTDIIRLGFLNKNKFTARSYEQGLNRINMSQSSYEDYKREELLARRYLTLMQSSIAVSDESLWEEYRIENQTADVEAIKLTAKDIDASLPAITSDEIVTFMTNSEADITTYYNEHLGDYTTPAKLRLTQIVIQKDLGKVNAGAKTDKANLADARYAIALKKVTDAPADFAQHYTDYDESEDKTNLGATALLPVDIMAPQIQTAVDGKKVGDIISTELNDRYIIAKIEEQTEKIVAPLDDAAKAVIAVTLLTQRRDAARMKEVSESILKLASSGMSLQDALAESMYKGVLAEAPQAPAAAESVSDEENAESSAENAEAPAETAETAETAEAPAETAETAEAPAEPAEAPEMPRMAIVAESDRVTVQTLNDLSISSGYLVGIGMSDDLARDIRSASDNTLLPTAYTIGEDVYIVRVRAKKEAKRDMFEAELASLRDEAIGEKSLRLVGDPQAVIDLTGPYGLWVQQKLDKAISEQRFKINNSYFNSEQKRIEQREQSR